MRLAENTRSGEIAYGVVAGVMWLAYVVSAVVGELKRRRTMKRKGAEAAPYDKAGVRQGSENEVLGGSSGEGSPSRGQGNGEWYGNKENEGHRYV